MKESTLQSNGEPPYQTLQSLMKQGTLQSVQDLVGMNTGADSLQVDEACWLNGTDDYELNVRLDATDLTIAGPSAQAVEGTLSALVQLGTTNCKQVTIQAFATQPRQRLPVLSSSELQVSKENTSLLIHFCTIPKCATWKHLTSKVSSLELRQCQIEDWNSIGAPETLILSLTMPEFTSFGTSELMVDTEIQHLKMVLHFWLQGDAWDAFCRLLAKARHLKSLEIQYLDLGDDGWDLLWSNLPQSIETVAVGFTDDFVDNFRRLTPERRVRRSTTVLDALPLYASLRSVSFPSCQQDKGTMQQVDAMLRTRSS